jgi:hypothetical protein
VVWRFFQNQPSDTLEPDVYLIMGKLQAKLDPNLNPLNLGASRKRKFNVWF